MDFFSRYDAKRKQYWVEVEQYFGSRPPLLFEHSTRLRHDLSGAHSMSAQLEDLLRHERAYPLLYFHFWLLDDWGVPEDAARQTFERHVFLAMVFTYAAMFVQESIVDEDTVMDKTYTFLANDLAQQAAGK